MTKPGFQSATRLPRDFARTRAAGLLLIAFALASASPSKTQEGLSVVPNFLTHEPLAETEHKDVYDPQTARKDLPDAPRRLPLQARTLTLEERLRIYRRSIFNPDSALGPAFGAALGQANNEPPEWGQGASGYGTRLASGYGRLVINRTIRFGVAALDHEDPRFHYSNEAGFWRRFRYASVHYVMTRTDEGDRIPAFSRFAGAYGAAFIANAWYPESRANTGHALMRGSTALTAGYAWHVFREFWPDIKKAIHHPKDDEAGYQEPQDPPH